MDKVLTETLPIDCKSWLQFYVSLKNGGLADEKQVVVCTYDTDRKLIQTTYEVSFVIKKALEELLEAIPNERAFRDLQMLQYPLLPTPTEMESSVRNTLTKLQKVVRVIEKHENF